MNKIASIFTEDWVRKVLAIFFAFVLWFDVQGRIAVDREIKLDVTTLSQQSLGANNFTLRIKSPRLGDPVFLDIHLIDLVLQQELIGIVAIHPAVEEEMIQISIHVIVFCHEGHNAKAL